MLEKQAPKIRYSSISISPFSSFMHTQPTKEGALTLPGHVLVRMYGARFEPCKANAAEDCCQCLAVVARRSMQSWKPSCFGSQAPVEPLNCALWPSPGDASRRDRESSASFPSFGREFPKRKGRERIHGISGTATCYRVRYAVGMLREDGKRTDTILRVWKAVGGFHVRIYE